MVFSLPTLIKAFLSVFQPYQQVFEKVVRCCTALPLYRVSNPCIVNTIVIIASRDWSEIVHILEIYVGTSVSNKFFIVLVSIL